MSLHQRAFAVVLASSGVVACSSSAAPDTDEPSRPSGPGAVDASARASDAPARSGDAPARPGDAPTSVVISEIMYHPFGEDGADDLHEFVEIHNAGTAAVRLGGWQLGGDVCYTFADAVVIRPGQYLVVAKDRAKLAEVRAYGLQVADLLGDYQGQLDNGRRGRVALLDGSGAAVDTVAYSSEFPWPIGADGLGLQPSWLPPSLQPATAHRYMGRSLERISFAVPASAVENWEASPLDGATPGRPNAAAGAPRAIAVTIAAAASADERPLIRPQDRVTVRAQMSERGTVSDVVLEYFVDDVTRADEKVTAVPMAAGPDGLRAELPPQIANSLVRFRVLGRRGGGMSEVISPRPSDPYAWHAYFVNPDVPGRTRAYHLFVAPADWGTMYRNCQPGWVDGCGLGENPMCKSCAVNEKWNATVPAVFVHDGRVYDVRTRYQGVKFSRLAGRTLARWTFPAPTAGPMPLQALGWKVVFPRYRRFEGKKSIKLNKRSQACTAIPDGVMSRVFRAVGVPEPRMRYARLYVNGGYYLYALEVESMDEVWLEDFFKDDGKGDLYNGNSIRWDEGPWGWGDFRLLLPFCGYTEVQRYAYTYERKTLEWKDNSDLVALLNGLHAARAAGDGPLRAYLDQNFDRELVLRYIAVMNWGGAWDDTYHNYYLYRRPSDRKWLMISSDMNILLTGFTYDGVTRVTTYGDYQKSFYIGREGDPSNNLQRWNFIKDSFLKVFKTEYDGVLRAIGPTALAPAAVDKHIDEIAAEFDVPEAKASLSTNSSCDDEALGPTGVTAVKTYVRERYRVLMQRLGL